MEERVGGNCMVVRAGGAVWRRGWEELPIAVCATQTNSSLCYTD